MNNYSFYKGSKALYYLIFFGCFLSFTPVLAKSVLRQQQSNTQQNLVHGTITDGTNPLPGVTIALKGKANSGSISDYNGQYSIAAAVSDTLIVSFIGFKTAMVPIKGRQAINIVLEYDTMALQEVRVNAGYYTVKESERTGSISRITAKDIETQPVTNVLATLQGRMAGVNVTQTTGVPGGGFEIQIRGQNSIRPEGNNPLYIIDGVPYASDPIGYNQTSTIFPTITSPLNSINPDAIESIEILKDADATAIYGSRGANGVVLITTKKGKEGKTKFTITASSGAGTVTKFMKLMDTQQYLAMRRQAFVNDKITTYPTSAYDINGTWDQNRYTDWQKELIGGTAVITDLQGTITGGSQYTQFLFSGNYNTQSTVFPGNFLYKKGGSQFNLNHQSVDGKFRLVFSVGYTAQNNNQPAGDLTYDSRALSPNAPALYDAVGNLNWENGTWDNPLRNLSAESKSKTKDLLANTILSYEIIPNLIIKSSFGYTDLQHEESRISPSTIYNPSYGYTSANSGLYLNNTKRSSWIIEPQINWEKKFGGGKFGILLGGTFQQQTTSRLFQSGSGFSSNSLIYDLASATTKQVLLSDETIYKYQAFFGRMNYNWHDRYIVNLTARRDGSSRFGPGNQFANFGAVGVAWLFSNESFLKDSSWFSFGKLRSSYGTTGSDQIGDYQYLNTYNSSGVNYESIVGLQPTRLFNPDFGWEINKKWEAALEMGFFADRIFFTGAWYQNRSSNQLVGIPLPGTTGFTQLQANLDATVENTGLEFTLRTVNFSTKHFNWTSSLNLTISRNELLSFPNLKSSTYKDRYRIGEPLNIQLGYKYVGIDPVTGVYQFEDQNNDGILSSPDDKQTVVNLNPDYFGGLQNQLSYKNWKLDFLFQFVKQLNRSYLLGLGGLMINRPERMVDSWQQTGDTGSYQIYSTGYNAAAVTAQSRYSTSDATVVDASYIRLKTVAVSYAVPLKTKAVQCTLTLQGQNLLTFTPYEDGDPEFKSSGYLPPLKVITAGIQLTF
ncbi:SusC/RagA family TonB-linked outer membrane protein [Flavobacterium sp. LS1R49]|uniref:SusC/RagA family TonB-linked outer membrane protein n=1 Tax=Flavobacterium shii TaxID=2987687 RepID=A0A9X2Z990_9FLAO|nr:SusC/RagA family TonB-linked outer membrane protein [Flavobacterium shii]MCV9926611.1 SusC/RagA family TonB-linked outer membrane protein [Flavobacterium shii]